MNKQDVMKLQVHVSFYSFLSLQDYVCVCANSVYCGFFLADLCSESERTL